MANEITLKIDLQVRNGNLVDTFSIGNQSINQAAVGGPTPGYFTLGTSEEELAFAELSSKGVCLIQNLDATNYIEYGFATGGPYGARVPAGQAYVIHLNATSLFMRANTAACKVLVKAYER